MKKQKLMIDNGFNYDVKRVLVDLWEESQENEIKTYRTLITVVLDDDPENKMGLGLYTQISGECKYCVARQIIEPVLELFGTIGGVFTIYDKSRQNVLEYFSMDDVMQHTIEEYGDFMRDLELSTNTPSSSKHTIH